MEADWIEHRRSDDGEHVGWMKPAGDGFIAIDMLGRPRTDVVDWFTAEETLDDLGLRYLADPHELILDDGAWLRVRIAEVTPDTVRVKKEDWGDMTAPQIYFTVPNPVPEDQLRPLAPKQAT
ncbi:hypothetical protein LN996_02050 [Arthrobacter sp. AK01]|uniref:hypothetical protein n=1 Tax=Arthrobacter sp. AK01 TaxID=2894084 RepID=UPI001E2966EA|nr:hypothetical protein [Arthrobacter sp. AK01]MCD4849587.1 hypothetical protein [Arthrobacter sp. AK01]